MNTILTRLKAATVFACLAAMLPASVAADTRDHTEPRWAAFDKPACATWALSQEKPPKPEAEEPADDECD